MARPRSWQDVPRSNPAAGARYTPGGLAAWRSVAPSGGYRSGGGRSRSRSRGGMTEAEQRALQIASESFEKEDDGFNLMNAGGKALLSVLDALDTPRAAVAATINEIADAGSYGGGFNWRDVVQNTRDNITMGEVFNVPEDAGPSTDINLFGHTLTIGPAFAADVLVDPLTYVTGGTARVGVEAGKPAARAFTKPAVKNFLGEQAARAAERAGTTFVDAVERSKFVTEQGEKLAATAAQKALKYRSNQALDPLEREAIGAEPGTFLKIPGRRLKIDKLVEAVAPGRVYESTVGTPALKVTRRELGLGRAAGKARAKVAESALGNRTARLFTKFPDLREKVLFGSPTDAMKAFQSMEEHSASQLQRRLMEQNWGTRINGLLSRAKKAGVDGEDLRYAIAEAVEEGEEQFAGDSSTRVLTKLNASSDPELLDEFRQFFRDLRDEANAIDPELPWMQYRKNYTTRTPSDEMIALRGGWSGTGGPLRRETFDFKRKYGLEEDQVSELMGRKLLDPSEAGGRSIERQINDILDEEGAPNLFERDAYKAFPDYVRRASKRYGDEWLAKQLRDLGIAEPGWTEQLTARGKTQGRAKAAIQALQTRAAVRAEKERLVAQDARSVSIASERNLGASQSKLDAGLQRAEDMRLRRSVMDADAVREYEAELRERAAVLQTRRQGLLDSLADPEGDVSGLRQAQRELGRRITQETQDAYSRVTELELAAMLAEEELGRAYDVLNQLQFGVTPEAINARRTLGEMEANAGTIADLSDKLRRAEQLLAQFEDLAAVDLTSVEAQLAQTDQMLKQAVEEYNANPAFADKVMVLADIKASLIHEKAVIERARGRVAQLDRSNPAGWLDEMDDLSNAQAMGNDIIHTLFPDLPPEVQGLRIREYFADKQPELLRQIDETNGQILSAFSDRDSMLVELAQIRQDKRLAEQKLASVKKGVTAEDRLIQEQQLELFTKADEAASRALQIEDEIAQMGSNLELMDQVNLTAERFVAAMKAKHAHYEGIAAAAEHKKQIAERVSQTWDRIAKDNLNKEQETALASALHAGYKELGAVSMTQDEWLVDGLRAATIMSPPAGLRPALQAFDRVTNLWKGYALSTPGTVLRNLFGGVFNNYLAGGVRPEDYAKMMSWRFGRGKMNEADRAIFQQLEDAGLFVGSGTSLEIERRVAGANLNPASTDFAPIRFMRGRQEDVEALVRGALAYRTIKNGGGMNDAIGRVIKYHFDYDDLSAVERSVFRRIVPFYTWTRKNFPLMLEQIVQNPTKFTRFYQLKNEIEEQSPEQEFVPSYFAENLAVRLPFNLGSGQAYALPDLPFTSLNDVTDPSLAFSQVSPFLKTPLEYAFGKQFFKGLPLEDEYQPVPKLMEAIPGLMPALDGMGLADRGPGGWMMKHKDMYVLEQMLPSYGKARRLFPSEQKYTERVQSAWLSFAFGLGLRTNTPTDQRNEAYRRIYDELERYQSRRELGFVDFGFTDEGNVRQPPAAYSVYDAYTGGN